MQKIILVGLGGFLGSVLRYLISGFVHRIADGSLFPYGTLAVNVAGCLVIGFLAGLSETRGVFTGETRLLLFVGLLGGLTTFSTFGYETFQFFRDAQILPAAFNMLLNVVLGIGGVWGGYVLSRVI